MNKDGILFIDKPKGITSHDVVARVRKALSTKQVGHAGTLDPLATGLLVILLGQATKLSDYLLNGDKGYEVLVRFGVVTDSWDMDGNIIEQKSVCLDKKIIEEKAHDLQGDLSLCVPSFSSIKINGKKLYEYAREDNEFKNISRDMNFYNYKTLEVDSDFLRARIYCKKGGYIRSWAYFLGQNLGAGGVVEELRRLWSAPYNLSESIKLDDFLEEARSEGIAEEGKIYFNENKKYFIPLQECLPNWKGFTVSGRDEKLMSNGQLPRDLLARLNFDQKQVNERKQNMGIKIMGGNKSLLSLVELQPYEKPKICRVFN